MEIVVLFGLPGAGKTFVGEVIRERYGFYFYEGDRDLPDEMKDRIRESLPIADDFRDKFFRRIIYNLQKNKESKIVLTQTFIKEKYRQWILDTFPGAKFVFIEASDTVREQRLKKRDDLNLVYAKKMTTLFEKPIIPH